MYIDNRTIDNDSPSLSIGEIRTGTGHARQPSASTRQYVLEKKTLRMRGTPEYNPLYDAFQSDFAEPKRFPENDFRPIVPPRFINNINENIENTYDRPRTYHVDGEYNQPYNVQQRYSTQNPKNVDSAQDSELDLLMDKLGGHTDKNDENETCTERKSRRRRRVLYNLVDFLAIVATCLIFGLIYILIKPVQRGFFCDDTSIQYPFRPDTVPMWLLGVYGGVGPIIIFLCVELWVVRPFRYRPGSGGQNLKQRQVDYVKTIFHTIFLFILGAAVCFLITEVGKRTIGRLRPYYLTVCNPIWSNINCTKTVMTASGTFVIPQYVTKHYCNSTFSERALQEAKLSFPSGHSSFSTYAFMFLFVYFEARIVCPNVQFVKPFLQCLCVAAAFFTCLSRVTDHKHHSTDVIGGALIGFCIAIFTAVRVGTYLWSFSVYCETDDETQKDRLPKDERITIPGVETKASGALRTNEQNPSTVIRERNGNRSNYDNVGSVQPEAQHRTISNLAKLSGGQHMSPVKSYEEANV